MKSVWTKIYIIEGCDIDEVSCNEIGLLNMTEAVLKTYIVGTCSDMCPIKERNIRQRERLLHPFEILEGTEHKALPVADPKKSVKAFSRSAAGRRPPSPSDLRPLPVLEKTMHYLLKMVKFDRSNDWINEYDFIFDRMRSIHQDAIIQGLNSKNAIFIFECMTRFLVYSGYRLCMEPRSRYDPVINRTHLQECLKKVLCMYDEHVSQCSTNIGSRPQLEALYIIHNLGDVTALQRGISLPKQYRTKDVEVALTMSIAFWNGHYIQAMKLMKALPMLISCVAALQIPKIRQKAFQVMSCAYSSKSLSYPAEDLQKSLLYSSNRELIDDCKQCNILYQEGAVKFLKGSFSETANNIFPRPLKLLDSKLECSNLPQVLLSGEEI